MHPLHSVVSSGMTRWYEFQASWLLPYKTLKIGHLYGNSQIRLRCTWPQISEGQVSFKVRRVRGTAISSPRWRFRTLSKANKIYDCP